MRKATKNLAMSAGLFAGVGGIEHGIFEMMQGSTRPAGLMIASMGPPCVPEEIWNACEPAMTIWPNFLVTGIISVILGVLTMIWSGAYLKTRFGGQGLMALSVLLLLFGGGIFPPVIGFIGGVFGLWIHKPITRQAGGFARLMAVFWPWLLVIFYVWLFSQFVIGHFFNDWLMRNNALIPGLILSLLPVTILTAWAKDVVTQPRS